MDRFDALRTLIAAIDGGSLSAASRTLRMPLPTVSRRVSELEAHVGTTLLIRTSRKLQLTDAGSAFVASARRVLADLEEAERTASGEYRTPSGDMLVTAPLMFGRLHVLPVVLAFLTEQPLVNVRLILSDDPVDMIDNHVDMAIRLGRLPDSTLVAIKVGEVDWITCASPGYLARRGTPTTPGQLKNHDCLAFEGLSPLRTWSFADGADNGPVAIKPRFAGNTADALIEAACAGLGVARMTSYQAAAELRSGRLVTILDGYRPEPIPVHLIHSRPGQTPLKLRAFIDFSVPRLRRALAALPGVKPIGPNRRQAKAKRPTIK